MSEKENSITSPPDFCEYASGSCDQDFSETPKLHSLFLYPSDPPLIAATIEAAVEELKRREPTSSWQTWRDLKIHGQIIFCTVCKAMRFADHVIADVTTLNFNLLFEIGFALGLGVPTIPIRDTTFVRDKTAFDKLGLLDTVGYVDFQNSSQLATRLSDRLPTSGIPSPVVETNFEAPLYVLKGPLETEGEIRLLSALKKSVVRFRTYDIRETPRLSLHEVRRQVGTSLAVVAHLLSPERQDAAIHNARCALTCGIAMATGKIVLMVQEGHAPQPIDYRDVVVSYRTPDQVKHLLPPTLKQIIERLQTRRFQLLRPQAGLLQKMDIGDVAAENEIRPLKSYFVETGQFNEASRGHARLVVGRKGSGKTAIFYAVRDSFPKTPAHVVLDLKPEGHQFTKMRETVLSRMSPGLQEHTLTAFWTCVLLAEITHKIVRTERTWAERHPPRWELYQRLRDLDEESSEVEEGDFSERLLRQVNRIAANFGEVEELTAQTTEQIFRGDIRTFSDALGAYLDDKQQVWILVDNLDKGWPTRGATPEDIMVIRTLLEATRQLQRQLERRRVDLKCLVFLRNDIFEHLLLETPDKGKDTPVTLDWSDPELFKEIFRRRAAASGAIEGDFDEIWNAVFEPFIGTTDSFGYVLNRTLMRPRDFLNFLHRAVETAINRGHDRVTADDLTQAEGMYSEDMLRSTAFEVLDIYPDDPDLLYSFLGCKTRLSREEARTLLAESGIDESIREEALRLLVWFAFLGVERTDADEVQYSFQVRYDLAKLMHPIERGRARFVVHPAFRRALECAD